MPSEPRRPPNSVVRTDGGPDRGRSRLRHLALRPDRFPTRHSTVMRLSPAPAAHNSSGLRPVAAAGAGVRFATGPIHGMRTLDSLPATTMQNGTGTGPVAFTFRGWSWLGHAEHCKAGHGAVWRNVTPRNGDNFSGLGSTCLGWARQCSAGRGNIATRGGIAGQFPRNGGAAHAKPGRGSAALGNNATQSGIWDNFSRPDLAGLGIAGRGRAGKGEATTSPGTVIPDIFPSTKKHPHNAGQRSKG